jgi:predicted GH43/DUF377 family glycosyl hydrolase
VATSAGAGHRQRERRVSPVPVIRTDHRLQADPSRVITQPFVPGEEILAEGESRVDVVMGRIMSMSEAEVHETLEQTLASFEHRHRNLAETLEQNFALVAHHLSHPGQLSRERRLLMGAYFTHEYSIEGAALFNPSMVPAPGESVGADGSQRFVMSLRAVGEGHRSSIEFRTGSVDRSGGLSLDPPGPFLVTGTRQAANHDRGLFLGKLAELGYANEITASVLDSVPESFSLGDLETALVNLNQRHFVRAAAYETVRLIHAIAAANYEVTFPPTSSIPERVLVPMSGDESHGVEDARFVRFEDDDGSVRYYGTYTAFDGMQVRPQLIETEDFATFRVSTLNGRFAQNKGMAIFPRRVGGKYMALSRWDRENTTIATSDNLRRWEEATVIECPEEPWELIQIGNCGSPLETPEGWLVLTHGVGPMRVYSIGAILLDLDDPRQVRGRLPFPIMTPDESERDGYVPNVLYSCGAMLHGDHLVLPYAFADVGVRFALVAVSDLLDQLLTPVSR